MALIAQRRSSCERRNLQAVSDLVAICDAVQTQRTSQLLFTSTIVVCQGRQQQPLKQQAPKLVWKLLYHQHSYKKK